MKILIADADPSVQQALTASLTGEGYEVVTAADGQVAWDLLQREAIQLLIVGATSGIDGPELIGRVRSANWPHQTYIVALTAKGERRAAAPGAKPQADDFLTKPVEPDELFTRLALAERILNLEGRFQKTAAQAEEASLYDSLTGLFSRQAVSTHAEAELSRALREQTPLGLVMLDIDHFRSVNDQHGRPVGEQVLQLVANVLARNKRAYDWAGRWGGEEFLLVLPGAGPVDAGRVAERMRSRVEAAELKLPDATTLQVRVSLGVTSVPNDPDSQPTLEMLLGQAEQALERAKASGRNRVCMFEGGEIVMP